MEIKLNSSSLRAQSARYRHWFSGRKIKLWRLTLLLGVISSLALWWAGLLGWLYLMSGVNLLILQLVLWQRLYLQALPPNGDIASNSIAIDQIASADLLSRIKPQQSPRQLWQSLSNDWALNFIVNRLQLSGEVAAELLSEDQGQMDSVWQQAIAIDRSVGGTEISSGAVVAALLLHTSGGEQWLRSNKLTPTDVAKAAYWQIRTDRVMIKLQQKPSFGGIARDWAGGYTPLLNQFGHNLSADVEHGAYQHLYLQTHTETLEQTIQLLSQPQKNSVALIGGTGSGKTSVGYALAERLLDPNNHQLRYHKVFALNASLIVSEAKRQGNLEALLLHIMAEARRARNIILFFDDAHSFFNEESGASDMTNILLQVMRSSNVRMLFALRPNDWQYLASVASDVTTSVQQLVVAEPEGEVIERVLEDQALSIEAESKTSITYAAIREAITLSDRYVSDQAFPGKAINLLRSAAAGSGGGWVTPEVVQRAVETTLGVKVGVAAPEETDVLLQLEDHLHRYMINQNFAVSVVADALRRARAGVRDVRRPVGSFLFLGPTGVGKTELTKALARVYYGGVDKIIRVDMSEYAESGATSRLLASSANAGSFLASVRQSPFSVVLLDEIEKASPEVVNLLLQMLDEGQLSDTDGRAVSFKDAIIIATSNAGADIIRANIEQGRDLEEFSGSFVDHLIDSQQFRPELINRFDEVVLFRPLNKQELRQVVELLLGEVNQNMSTQQITIQLSEAAIDTIVEQGYDPRLGARPMRRMMQRTVENVVAKKVLSGEVQPGGSVLLDAQDLA